MNQLHPLFAEILRGHGLPQSAGESAESDRMGRYVTALQRHDWAFELSDSGAIWRRGREALAHLLAERAAIDPDARVWNTHCTPDHAVRPQ